ncbi:VOC family protein [Alteromonas sp.]|uniref:VOC family protein n=1 Tax=Alteromonas sp. TaxID=232 RepID=UPI000B64DB7B|nr:VOC family protein [Alteromonas sp.]MAI37878.1 glyoxalase [Alteromonas sp.]OUX87397.1 MAG: glyoxalase [Alteromonas sp. TMED35]|tara:strand:- start:26345 stop:26716 length:372 start_codon:yes stop_codon:yes gene_type:complete
MINYVTLGVSDIEKSASFYESLLENFGVKRLVNMERIKYIGKSMKEPMIAVCIPWDEKEPSPGNGNMFSIAPGNKQKVDKMHEKALSLGATCDGAPGQRVPGKFYAAYVRDFDGNKICFNFFG